MLTAMKEFKEEAKSLKPAVAKKLLDEVIKDVDFNQESAEKSSYAIQFIYQWVSAMYSFNFEYVRAGPLRKQMDDMK
jgi:hypothetical protein